MGILDNIIGIGSKKQEIGSYSYAPAQVFHKPYETYAPTTSNTASYQISPQYTYAVQIASPEASITTTKKDDLISKQATSQEPRISAPSTAGTSAPGAGISNTTLAIGAIVIGSAFVLTRKK